MKFTTLLKDVILENSRFEILRTALTKPSKDKEGKTVKPKLSIQEFIQLVQADPTTRMNNVDPESADSKELEKIKAGKYVNWLIKNYLTPITERQPSDSGYEREVKQVKETFLEDLYKVTEDLQKFIRFNKKIPLENRDINKLTTAQLYDAVKNFDLTLATTTKAERKSAPVHPGAELFFEGPNWKVIKIENKGASGKEAACFYGGNNKETRWCTSAPGASWFDRYIKDGPLYVVFNPNDTNIAPETGLPVERYQFHFPSNQFMDRHDHSVNLINLLNGPMKELKMAFKPEFAEGLTVGGEKLVIDSFSQGNVGKFIGLYGLDELIDNLPLSLKEFQISNKERDSKIIITIPTSISRFKNLQMLLFDNCIESIPDEICELPELRFLALINNQNLTSIPECLSDVPSLLFLNLKGSGNVKIPQRIMDKANDLGNGMLDLQ
jgi:Leucine-rich repeat (LRR) protein